MFEDCNIGKREGAVYYNCILYVISNSKGNLLHTGLFVDSQNNKIRIGNNMGTLTQNNIQSIYIENIFIKKIVSK